MSGMLSNTADRKPRPSAVGHEAAGKRSTGIIEAHRTRESRKTEPFSAPRSTGQLGVRNRAVNRIANQTAAPRKGKRSLMSLKWVLIVTLTTIAATRMKATIATRAPSIRVAASASFWIGE